MGRGRRDRTSWRGGHECLRELYCMTVRKYSGNNRASKRTHCCDAWVASGGLGCFLGAKVRAWLLCWSCSSV